MTEILNKILEIINFTLNLCGMLFILWGGLEAAIRVLWGDLRGHQEDTLLEKKNRKAFASKLILGLEFFIAVDILSTFEHTSWESLGMLTALIVIRAMLSFVLTVEMKSGPVKLTTLKK